jgi:hypothetical protein
MGTAREESPRVDNMRRVSCWLALAVGGILPSVGCQVEYAGMTLPSGKYMHDDVQYFPSGPDFPWANSQAATQRARMRGMGIEPPPAPGASPTAGGAELGSQMGAGRFTDVNQVPGDAAPNAPQPVPPGAPSGALPGLAPGGADVNPVPPPGGVPVPRGAVPNPGN